MPRPPLFKMPYGIDTPPIKQVLHWKPGGLFRKWRARVIEDDLRPNVRRLTAEDLDRREDFVVWLVSLPKGISGSICLISAK